MKYRPQRDRKIRKVGFWLFVAGNAGLWIYVGQEMDAVSRFLLLLLQVFLVAVAAAVL